VSASAAPVSTSRKMTENDVCVMTKIRFLGRSGIITEVKGPKVQVIFHDNGRKVTETRKDKRCFFLKKQTKKKKKKKQEWVKKEGLLAKGIVDK
jgi:hypothetical protein